MVSRSMLDKERRNCGTSCKVAGVWRASFLSCHLARIVFVVQHNLFRTAHNVQSSFKAVSLKFLLFQRLFSGFYNLDVFPNQENLRVNS
jgi:hypothetical protein